VSIWFKFIFNPNEVFSNLISLMYLLIKFNNMYEKGALFCASLRAYILREVVSSYFPSFRCFLSPSLSSLCEVLEDYTSIFSPSSFSLSSHTYVAIREICHLRTSARGGRPMYNMPRKNEFSHCFTLFSYFLRGLCFRMVRFFYLIIFILI
jgi:hypothetical protein